MVPDGPHMVPDCPHMVSDGPHMVQYGSHMVVDSSISMMSVLLWMGSGVAVEAYP